MGSTQNNPIWKTGERLINAARAGDAHRLRQLISKGADVNYGDRSNYTALHYAALIRHVDCVRVLIDHGSDIHTRGDTGLTALHAAAFGGSTECIKLLIPKGCDINSRTDDGVTVLHAAAQSRNIECVQLLINKGCDIYVRSNDGASVLYSAALGGKPECVDWLINKGCDINARAASGLTILHAAARGGSTECVDLLINKGCDTQARDYKGRTVLNAAAQSGKIECVELLINKGCDIHARDNEGRTVLHAAAQSGKIECVELLINKGCDIHSRTNGEGTVLHWAVYGGKTECVQLFVDKGCDIYARDENGQTTLHAAARAGSTECIQFIHGLGVDFSLKCKEGKTAYDWAKQEGKTEAAKLLQRLSKIKPSNQQKGKNNKQGDQEPEPSTKFKERSTKSDRCIKDRESSEITDEPLEQGTSYQLQQLNEDKNQSRYPSYNSKPNEIEESTTKLKEKQSGCTGCKSMLNSLVQDTTQLKQKVVEMVDLGVYAKENAASKDHISSLETRMKSSEDFGRQSRETQRNNDKLIQENRYLKRNITALELRLKSIEQRERGYSNLPHVATPPEGFDIGNVVGKDYMQPQMEEIFCNKTFQAFKEYADPVLITDYLWAKHIITERQFQEIKAQTSDIGKAEYLWLLIKRGRYYLDAIRKASMDTNQGQIAALLECTSRMEKLVNYQDVGVHIPNMTIRKPRGSLQYVIMKEWTIYAGVSVAIFIAVLGILLCVFVPTERLF